MKEGKKKLEWSKKLTLWAFVIFISQILAGAVFTILDKPVDIFTVSIPTTGGILGCAVTFYFNKAKIENVFKGKIQFLELKLKLNREYEDEKSNDVITEELSSVNECLDGTINETMKEAVSLKIETKQEGLL